VAIGSTNNTTQRQNNETVSRVLSPPPIPSPKLDSPVSKPSRRAQKKREEPERLKWIKRRKKLEKIGVDLSAVSVGREDLENWLDPDYRNKNRGTKNLYVVWKGRKVGVFCGWDVTNSHVKSFKDAKFMKVASEAEAFQILEDNLLHKGGD